MAFARRRKVRIWPAWMRTVDKMIENGVRVKASCGSCSRVEEVDLNRIKMLNGGDGSMSLINKRGRCKHCDGGRVVFLYERGENAPFFPLLDSSDRE